MPAAPRGGTSPEGQVWRVALQLQRPQNQLVLTPARATKSRYVRNSELRRPHPRQRTPRPSTTTPELPAENWTYAPLDVDNDDVSVLTPGTPLVSWPPGACPVQQRPLPEPLDTRPAGRPG